MGDSLKSLQRIAKVQGEMVKLAEWRIAAAKRQIETLENDRAQLCGYVAETSDLGVPMAKAALRSMHAIDRRKAEVERARDAETERLDTLKRRDRALATRVEAAAAAVARATEKAELVAAIETFLARPIGMT